MQLTKRAEAYPWGMADALALACARDCKWHDGRRRLDLAACARQSCRCIGEAANPGPAPVPAPPPLFPAASRGGRPRRTASRSARPPLPDGPVVAPATMQLGTASVAGFQRWLASVTGSETPVRTLAAVPRLLDELLRTYGRHLYHCDQPMYVYRHLLAALQRQHLHLRRQLPCAWGLMSAWEMLEPTQHRPPVPEPVVKAMIAVALGWGWVRTAALLAAVFFGITRPGELIGATRGHLLLPADMLSDERVAYIIHAVPKTRTRGPRIQHSSIQDELTIRLLERAFSNDPALVQLFPASASVFRTRFNALLRALRIPAGTYTPGGLLGGGACAAFRRTPDVTLLCWRMRLANTATLSSYLQETLAATSLRTLPAEALTCVAVASRLLPFLANL